MKKAVTFEDVLIPFSRNGKEETIYWTFTSSPALGANDKICGVLVTCMETTKYLVDKKQKE